MQNQMLKDAYEISKNVISANSGEMGIYAGGSYFREYWSRDAFFSLIGSVSTHPEISKKSLQTFLNFQDTNGQVPLTISEVNRILRVLGIDVKRHRLYCRYDYPLGEKTQDSNLLFIIAFDRYVSETDDKEFLLENISKIAAASQWSNQHDNGDLIYEGKIANWMDTLLYSGYNMYTNVLYYQSLRSLSRLYQRAGIYGYEIYEDKADRILNAIQEKFWKGRYFSRWSHNDDFTGSGNALALMYGIADDQQVDSIVDYIENRGLNKQPLLEADRKIPVRKRRKFPLALGMYEYSKTPWPWIGCAYAIGLINYKRDNALKVLESVARSITTGDTAYEIVDMDGNRGKSKIYRSEKDFSWTAGLYINAYEQMDL